MSGLIIPFKTVVDAEARAVIENLQNKLTKAEGEAQDWKNQANRAQREVDQFKADICKLKAFKEKLEPLVRDLMEFCDIEEYVGW